MRLRILSPRVGSLISASKRAPLDELQRRLMSSGAGLWTGDEHSPKRWQDAVLCYDYRHSEMYELPDVNLFTSDGDADPDALVHSETSAVNDMY